MTGFVDAQTWDAGVEISVLGIKLGTFYGNLQQGLSVNVDILLTNGQIKLYLKGTQVWINVNLWRFSLMGRSRRKSASSLPLP
jgi:hypothetical protein